jgi:hypothetical protein
MSCSYSRVWLNLAGRTNHGIGVILPIAKPALLVALGPDHRKVDSMAIMGSGK